MIIIGLWELLTVLNIIVLASVLYLVGYLAEKYHELAGKHQREKKHV
nr:MAG TPA: hypothetical protein [Herelleviridae sp.]